MMIKPFSRGRFDELPELPRLPHVYTRVPGRDIELDSRHFGRHRVHIRELGEGPPLLLVHGLMTSSYSWRYVFEPLSKHYRVIAPDLPGAGRSDKPKVDYSAEALAEWIVELVDALGIRGARAIGNSLGGYLCMRAVLEQPTLFERLVNIHSPGIPEMRLALLRVALALPGMRSVLATFARRAPERWAHRNVHYFDESLKSLEEAREYGSAIASADGARAFVAWLGDALRPASLEAFVHALERRRDEKLGFPIPLLLVYARQDPMVPPRVGEELSRLIPDARFEWLDESSHFSHVDTPERLLEIVLPFLSSQQT